jgi:hypothetical protein
MEIRGTAAIVRGDDQRKPARDHQRPAASCHIVTNAMLNGEVIRLDGAIRMAPR